MDFRFLVTGSDNLQQWWQTELLLHTYKKNHPEIPLTILWSCKNPFNPKWLPDWPDYYITPLYENITNGKYVPMNRIAGLDTWLKKNDIKEEYIIVLDPDMIFLRKIKDTELQRMGLSKCNLVCGRDIWREPKDNSLSYKTFKQFLPNQNIEHISPSIVPIFSHIDDLRCIADRWRDMTVKIHNSTYRQWTSELYAFDIICYDLGINVYATKALYHTSNEILSAAPFLHYFSLLTNISKTWYFNKHEWKKQLPLNLEYPKDTKGMSSHFVMNMIERFGGNIKP